MIINHLRIINKGKEIVNCCFKDENKEGNYIFKSLIIGQNATGKSFLLRQICDIFEMIEHLKEDIKEKKLKKTYDYYEICYILEGHQYIFTIDKKNNIQSRVDDIDISLEKFILPNKIIASTYLFDDKFKFSKNENESIYHYAGVKTTSNAVFIISTQRQLLEYLINFIDHQKKEILPETLNYLGYSPSITIDVRLKKIDLETLIDRRMKKKLISSKLIDFLDKGDYYKLNRFFDYDKEIIINIDLLKKVSLDSIEILKNIALLDDLSAIRNIEIFLYKEKERIPYKYCSSGEKQLLFTFLKIGSAIENNSIVLIDEPENSLHASWQTRYISDLEKIFLKLNYNLHFIISTHSAYMLSSLFEQSSSLITVKSIMKNGVLSRRFELVPFSTYSWSIENILYNVLHVKTVRNPYIEEDLINFLYYLSNGKEKVSSEEANIIYKKFKKLPLTEKDPLSEVLKKHSNEFEV